MYKFLDAFVKCVYDMIQLTPFIEIQQSAFYPEFSRIIL